MRMIVCLLLAGLAGTAQAETVKFTTEDYPPYNFRDGAGYSGPGYDLVVAIMENVKADYTVEMMPWARALSLAQTEANHCVFTTAHIAERDTLFKWVEPVAIERNMMIARQGSGVAAKTMDEARKYNIGTQRDDYTQEILVRNGFPRIDLATDLGLTLKKLLGDRIDMMPISEKYYNDLRDQGNPVEAQFILSEEKLGIACNPATPDALVAEMQASLDALNTSGRQKAIFDKYKMPLGY